MPGPVASELGVVRESMGSEKPQQREGGKGNWETDTGSMAAENL